MIRLFDHPNHGPTVCTDGDGVGTEEYRIESAETTCTGVIGEQCTTTSTVTFLPEPSGGLLAAVVLLAVLRRRFKR